MTADEPVEARRHEWAIRGRSKTERCRACGLWRTEVSEAEPCQPSPSVPVESREQPRGVEIRSRQFGKTAEMLRRLAVEIETRDALLTEALAERDRARDLAAHLEAAMPEWAPGRWWRAVAADGLLWCESSDEEEVRASMREGDRLERLYDEVPRSEWRPAAHLEAEQAEETP